MAAAAAGRVVRVAGGAPTGLLAASPPPRAATAEEMELPRAAVAGPAVAEVAVAPAALVRMERRVLLLELQAAAPAGLLGSAAPSTGRSACAPATAAEERGRAAAAAPAEAGAGVVGRRLDSARAVLAVLATVTCPLPAAAARLCARVVCRPSRAGLEAAPLPAPALLSTALLSSAVAVRALPKDTTSAAALLPGGGC